jgi:shikimate kinase
VLSENIILIGMPSSGKSSVGKELSIVLGYEYIDTDLVIKKSEDMELKKIVVEKGLDEFLCIQEKNILRINIDKNQIISTGGSVIYSEKSMKYLGEKGIIIYLNTSLKVLKKRIAEGRRFAKNKKTNFDELYNERVELYKKYSDFEIKCDGKNVETIAREIVKKLQKFNKNNF